MGDEVTLTVNSQLKLILEDMVKIQRKSMDVNKVMQEMAKKLGEGTKKGVKDTEEAAKKSGGTIKRMLETLKGDLKALASLEGIQAGLKLSNQFKGSIEQTVKLGDTIRRLGPTLGIAAKNFSSFHSQFIKGMGSIGLSSEAAEKALEGLAETPVRGEENLLEYAKTAGQLTQISGQKGKEGEVAGGISGLIQARGGDVNDMKEMKSIAEDLRRVQVATGKGPTETIAAMTEMFNSMSADFRKTVTTRGLSQMAAAAHAAGPQSTKFLESFLSLSKTQRSGLEARGVGGLVTKEGGLDPEQIKKFYEEAKKLGGGDIRIGLKAMGIESDDAAEGFVRLADHLKEVKKAQEEVAHASGDLATQFEQSKGLSDQFESSLNKVKGSISGAIAGIAQGGTEFLKGAGKTKTGAIGTVLGGGALAAMLTGGGIKGILGMGKNILKDEAKKKAIEGITGEKVQDVNVINADEIGEAAHGGGAMDSIGGGKGFMGKAAGVAGKAASVVGGAGAAFAVGTAIGGGINELVDNSKLGEWRDKLFDTIIEAHQNAKVPPTRVIVDTAKGIKATNPTSRGQTQ